jgi:long-chain fatty acid transport protein
VIRFFRLALPRFSQMSARRTPVRRISARSTITLSATLLGMLSSALISNPACAAAYQFYELGTPIVGTAAVGQAAVAEDASTAYFNPAGMGLFQSTQLMLGSQILVPYINFSRNVNATSISGNNGSNAGQLTPGMDVYLAYHASENLRLGLSVTSPYGGALNYNDGWVGRYVVQNVIFYTINFNPSVAYRISDWVSLGAGLALEYMNLQETVALPIPTLPLVDGQVKVSVANYAPGFNAGVMFRPSPSTKIGIAYRSRILHDLHGNTTFLRISTTPNTSTKMIMPQSIIASLAQDFNRFTLLGELGWANWAQMQNTILTVSNYTVVTPLDWNNTYRVGLGGQYRFTPCFLLQAGASYDSSPTNSSHRLPDLPMDRQIRAGAGVMYRFIPQATLGASYEYLNFGRGNVRNVSTNGSLVGSYSRNYANTFQVSLNVDA